MGGLLLLLVVVSALGKSIASVLPKFGPFISAQYLHLICWPPAPGPHGSSHVVHTAPAARHAGAAPARRRGGAEAPGSHAPVYPTPAGNTAGSSMYRTGSSMLKDGGEVSDTRMAGLVVIVPHH